MRQQRTREPEEYARLHERAAVFFELIGQRERASLERERARRAREETAAADEPLRRSSAR